MQTLASLRQEALFHLSAHIPPKQTKTSVDLI